MLINFTLNWLISNQLLKLSDFVIFKTASLMPYPSLVQGLTPVYVGHNFHSGTQEAEEGRPCNFEASLIFRESFRIDNKETKATTTKLCRR